MKILISDPLSEEGLNILKQEKTFEVDVCTALNPQQLLDCIGQYDALIVRSTTRVTKDVIEKGKRLKFIGRAGVGVDNIDVEVATKNGIVVINTPGGNTISTAEHTFSMLMALSRNIPQANACLKSGIWDRKKFIGVELRGKTLGIIGLGRIGTEVAKRAIAFGMKVVAYDPFLSVERASKMDVVLVDLKNLLKDSDYITVHVPITDETRHIIGAKELSMVKKGVRIINCARGGIIDEMALTDAIKNNQVAGAAFDVYEQEPPEKHHPFFSIENVIMTPHLGASTEEAQSAVATEIAQLIKDALLGKGIKNAVNMPSIGADIMKGVEPYLYLAEKIGLMHAQILEGRISEVSINYSGDVTSLDVRFITRSIIKGLLAPIVGTLVNYVNAMIIADERGLKILESRSTAVEDFANLICVTVKTDRGENSIAGTLFTKKNPRIVRINEFYVDAMPSGNMLLVDNIDVPGIVGQIGNILGKNSINIAGMTFGREKPGGRAITVLNVDNPVSEDVLDKIKKSSNIKNVRLIKL